MIKNIQKILLVVIIGIFIAGIVNATFSDWWKTVKHIEPRTDSAVDIGSSAKNIRNIYTDNVLITDSALIGTALKLQSGSITDTSGAISFGDENLTTTGLLSAARAHFTATSETMDTLRLKADTSIGSITFTGTGDDDMSTSGTYIGTSNTDFYVEIDGTGSPNTFKWSNDGGGSFEATGVAITKAAQSLG